MKKMTKKAKPGARKRAPVATDPAQPPLAHAEPTPPSLPAPPVQEKMVTIWYLVGLVLTSMGSLVFLTGVYYLAKPEEVHTVLAHLHPNLWWGAIMLIGGITFILTNRRATVD